MLLGAHESPILGNGELILTNCRKQTSSIAHAQKHKVAMKENIQSPSQQDDVSAPAHARIDEIKQSYISVSEKYAGIFGYTAKEFLEQFRTLEQDINLVHPDDRAIIDTFYMKTRPGDTTLEYRILHRDGSVIHVRELVHQILDENGKLFESTSILQKLPD